MLALPVVYILLSILFTRCDCFYIKLNNLII